MSALPPRDAASCEVLSRVWRLRCRRRAPTATVRCRPRRSSVPSALIPPPASPRCRHRPHRHRRRAAILLAGRVHAEAPRRAHSRVEGALAGERKHVTVLFADLKDRWSCSRTRSRRRAPAPRCRPRDHDGGRASVRGHGEPGDGRRHHGALRRAAGARDHAVRAAYAALKMHAAVTAYAGRSIAALRAIAIRVGLNSGEVVVRSIGNDLNMDYTASDRRRISRPAWSRWRCRARFS